MTSERKPDQSKEDAVIEAACDQMREYDYIRLTWYDFNGSPRTRIVPSRNVDRVMPGGFGVYEGALYTGPRTTLPEALLMEHNTRLGASSGNCDVVPVIGTLTPIPWAGANKYKVGEMMCNLITKQGLPISSLPRNVAQKQLARLDDLGLKLMSCFETEFILEDKETHKPVFDGSDIFSPMFFEEQGEYFYQVDQQMLHAGLNCEMFQTEYGPGQFEITSVPMWGLDAIDKTFLLKYGLKEIAHKYGLEATFMAKPDPTKSGSGAHYNFSVWKDDTNMFYDKDDALSLSSFAQHWIGGMMKHGRALSALQSPTINCYRRLQGAWAPSKVFWGIENRNAALRVKVGGNSSTYMENRVPSSSANYYFVLAATIAAGLEGVNNKTELPKQGPDNSAQLPLTLADALDALEADEAMVNALGPEFVEWYCRVKRMTDVEIFKDSDVTKPDPKALEKERYYYNITM